MITPHSAAFNKPFGKFLGHHHDPDWTTKWTNLAIRNALLLLATLFIFRLEKVYFFQVDLDALTWVTLCIPEIGTVLFFESLLLIGIFRFGSPNSRIPYLGFYIAHGLLYLIALIEHQFLIKTGTQVDATLITYSVRHAQELAEVLGSGFDMGLLIRFIVVVCGFTLGFTGKPHQILTRRSLPYFLCGTFILCPVSLLSAQPTGGTSIPFTSKIYFDFFVPYNKDILAHIKRSVSPHVLYQAPELISTTTTQQPNIILLILESTGARAVPPYQAHSQDNRTPFFSKIAQEGLVFDSVYTTVPHTSKALVGLFCGMYPKLTQPILESTNDPFHLRCLPDLLQEVGYRTTFMQTAKGEFENRPGLLRNLGFQSWFLQEDFTGSFKEVGYFGMDEFAMVDPAISWVKERPDQPFFLTLLTITTHHPYQTPPMDAWPKRAEEFQGYKDGIEHLDHFASTFYQKLQEAHLADNTLLIIVGDHGEAFGEHYRRQHDVVPYEEGIHVPLYMYHPHLLGKARHVTGLRHHIDIFPTILEVLGLQWKGQLPGKSLLTTEGHSFVMSSCWYTNFCLALRTEQWKYIYHYGRMMPEIFDLSSDPDETRNLVSTVASTTQDEAWKNLLSLKVSVDHFYDQYSPNDNSVLVQKNHP